MANYEISGTLIKKFDTQVITEKFKKREFALETREDYNGGTISNFVKIQLVQAKCEMLDNYNEGDEVKVSFNIKGNKWEKNGVTNYITNLDAWRIEKQGNESNLAYSNPTATQTVDETPAAPVDFFPENDVADDLPF